MMTRSTYIARASATAIAASLALSPIYAAAPQPIIDLSKSPALSAEEAAPTGTAAPERKIGPFDEQTAEIGGGAIAALLIGMGVLALSRRKRRRDEESWSDESTGPVAEEASAPAEEPMPRHDPTGERAYAEPARARHETEVMAATGAGASAFAWGNRHRDGQQSDDDGSDRRPGETWVERAYRGPSPANPSVSLKNRLARAAFFDKREREVAAGKAESVDPDAGLPEAAVNERELESA